jgi:RimJ/RimL family protein N-acetyltransferase
MNLSFELETKRLILRPVNINDAESIFSYRSDAITNQYQGWIPKTIDDAQIFISKVSEKINEYDTWFQFAIVLSETDELIGDIGIHFLDEENYQAELGCTLAKNQHRKGIAGEALRAIIDYLFEDLKKTSNNLFY